MLEDDTPEDNPELEDGEHLEKLEAAVQEFANAMAGRGVILKSSLLVWEQMRFDEDGDALSQIKYALPTLGSSLSSTLGLVQSAAEFIKRDIWDVWWAEKQRGE